MKCDKWTSFPSRRIQMAQFRGMRADLPDQGRLQTLPEHGRPVNRAFGRESCHLPGRARQHFACQASVTNGLFRRPRFFDYLVEHPGGFRGPLRAPGPQKGNQKPPITPTSRQLLLAALLFSVAIQCYGCEQQYAHSQDSSPK